MYLQNNILPGTKFIGFVGLIFCFFFHSQVFAQSDRETVIQERQKVEHSEKAKEKKVKQEVTEENSYSPKDKEDSSFRNDKKKESGNYHSSYSEENESFEAKDGEKPSVSFNIFLYVLDRFKEN
ncbi:hypothetical protein [Pleomorphovibrio marinus]|uniref:hypothetical protein n=1 Tax=Pleomorphovibrio marinus TaxID=2164132 RepID=UPI000E0A5C9F|nr:hypothetical protein [Pleomorphovibrio marinus]